MGALFGLDGYDFMIYNVSRKWGMVPERRKNHAVGTWWSAVVGFSPRRALCEGERCGARLPLVVGARGADDGLCGRLQPCLPVALQEQEAAAGEGREGGAPARRRHRLASRRNTTKRRKKKGAFATAGPL